MTRWFVGLAVVVAALGQDLELGRRVFESQCAVCHGVKGGGGRGPTLNRARLDLAPDDAALQELISQGSPPDMPGSWQLSARDLVNVAAFVRSLGAVAPEQLVAGDARRGRALYEARGCPGCHIVAGVGMGFGPELSRIGARRSAAYLREALVKPGAYVSEEFVSAVAVLPSGHSVRGLRANEDSFTVQIKDVSGRFHSFRKADLKALTISKDSLMPAYPDGSEVDDLVAYLAGLK